MSTAAAKRESWRERWGRPPRRLRFTRAGQYYVGYTLVIGVAAINTGNNLLFLVLGLLLSGIVLSGILSELALRGLRAFRQLPAEATAGREALVGLRLENRSSRGESLAIVVRDVTNRGVAGEAFALRLGAGETAELGYRFTPQRRGRIEFIRLELATRYPFGLFEKWRELDVEGELVVFPRAVAGPAPRDRSPRPGGERASGEVGPGSDFFALREARPEDDARSIHWRSSARRGRTVVIERERERRRRVAVLVDARGAVTEAALDGVAERAAGAVRQALDEGCDVALSTNDARLPFGQGPAHVRRLMRGLALLEPPKTAAAPAPIQGAQVVLVDAAATSQEGAA